MKAIKKPTHQKINEFPLLQSLDYLSNYFHFPEVKSKPMTRVLAVIAPPANKPVNQSHANQTNEKALTTAAAETAAHPVPNPRKQAGVEKKKTTLKCAYSGDGYFMYFCNF